jgi:hypothetical protein
MDAAPDDYFQPDRRPPPDVPLISPQAGCITGDVKGVTVASKAATWMQSVALVARISA